MSLGSITIHWILERPGLMLPLMTQLLIRLYGIQKMISLELNRILFYSKLFPLILKRVKAIQRVIFQ